MSVPAPELSTRSVALRPLLPSDTEWCYALMCGPAGDQWRYRGRTPSPDTVAADLWRGIYAQYLVTDRSDGTPTGLVGIYNASTEAGRAHAFAVAQPGRSHLVIEGFGVLCARAFDHFGFQRLFIEAPEFNVPFFESLGAAAVVEGRLRNYEFWKGTYWDLFIMSLNAESFEQRFGPLLRSRQTKHIQCRPDGETELVELISELWPLDSLSAVEVLCNLEEVVGQPLPAAILEGLDLTSATLFAEELLRRARDARAASSPTR